MNVLGFLLSFSPWLAFAIIPSNDITQLEVALLVGLILSVTVTYKDLKAKMLLPWVTFIYFFILSILVIILKFEPILAYIGLLSNLVLTLIAFGSIGIKQPFTIQYAKKEVPPEKWNDPIFIKINRNMSGFWGFLFLIGFAQSVIKFYNPSTVSYLGGVSLLLTIIIGTLFNNKYPKYVRRKIAVSAEKGQSNKSINYSH